MEKETGTVSNNPAVAAADAASAKSTASSPAVKDASTVTAAPAAAPAAKESLGERIEDGFKTVFDDAKNDVEGLVKAPTKIAETFDVVLKDWPALKPILTKLLQDGEKVATDAGIDVSDKGLDIPQDVATWQAIQAFFAYLKGTAVPALEQAGAQINAAS